MCARPLKTSSLTCSVRVALDTPPWRMVKGGVRNCDSLVHLTHHSKPSRGPHSSHDVLPVEDVRVPIVQAHGPLGHVALDDRGERKLGGSSEGGHGSGALGEDPAGKEGQQSAP